MNFSPKTLTNFKKKKKKKKKNQSKIKLLEKGI